MTNSSLYSLSVKKKSPPNDKQQRIFLSSFSLQTGNQRTESAPMAERSCLTKYKNTFLGQEYSLGMECRSRTKGFACKSHDLKNRMLIQTSTKNQLAPFFPHRLIGIAFQIQKPPLLFKRCSGQLKSCLALPPSTKIRA